MGSASSKSQISRYSTEAENLIFLMMDETDIFGNDELLENQLKIHFCAKILNPPYCSKNIQKLKSVEEKLRTNKNVFASFHNKEDDAQKGQLLPKKDRTLDEYKNLKPLKMPKTQRKTSETRKRQFPRAKIPAKSAKTIYNEPKTQEASENPPGASKTPTETEILLRNFSEKQSKYLKRRIALAETKLDPYADFVDLRKQLLEKAALSYLSKQKELEKEGSEENFLRLAKVNFLEEIFEINEDITDKVKKEKEEKLTSNKKNLQTGGNSSEDNVTQQIKTDASKQEKSSEAKDKKVFTLERLEKKLKRKEFPKGFPVEFYRLVLEQIDTIPIVFTKLKKKFKENGQINSEKNKGQIDSQNPSDSKKEHSGVNEITPFRRRDELQQLNISFMHQQRAQSRLSSSASSSSTNSSEPILTMQYPRYVTNQSSNPDSRISFSTVVDLIQQIQNNLGGNGSNVDLSTLFLRSIDDFIPFGDFNISENRSLVVRRNVYKDEPFYAMTLLKLCFKKVEKNTETLYESLFSATGDVETKKRDHEKKFFKATEYLLMLSQRHLLTSVWTATKKDTSAIKSLEEYVTLVLEISKKLLKKVRDLLRSKWGQNWVQVMEFVKNSIVSKTLPVILSVLGAISGSELLITLLVSDLVKNLSELSTILKQIWDLNPEKPEEKDPKFLTSDFITGHKVVESLHTYYNDSIYESSLTLPNSQYLLIKFDRNCFTEKKEDILKIWDKKGIKVFEYSGKSQAWLKKLYMVIGDTIKFKFSTLRNSSSVKSNFGYKFSVYGISIRKQEMIEDWLKSALSVTSLVCFNLIKHSNISKDEINLQNLQIAPLFSSGRLGGGFIVKKYDFGKVKDKSEYYEKCVSIFKEGLIKEFGLAQSAVSFQKIKADYNRKRNKEVLKVLDKIEIEGNNIKRNILTKYQEKLANFNVDDLTTTKKEEILEDISSKIAQKANLLLNYSSYNKRNKKDFTEQEILIMLEMTKVYTRFVISSITIESIKNSILNQTKRARNRILSYDTITKLLNEMKEESLLLVILSNFRISSIPDHRMKDIETVTKETKAELSESFARFFQNLKTILSNENKSDILRAQVLCRLTGEISMDDLVLFKQTKFSECIEMISKKRFERIKGKNDPVLASHRRLGNIAKLLEDYICFKTSRVNFVVSDFVQLFSNSREQNGLTETYTKIQTSKVKHFIEELKTYSQRLRDSKAETKKALNLSETSITDKNGKRYVFNDYLSFIKSGSREDYLTVEQEAFDTLRLFSLITNTPVYSHIGFFSSSVVLNTLLSLIKTGSPRIQSLSLIICRESFRTIKESDFNTMHFTTEIFNEFLSSSGTAVSNSKAFVEYLFLRISDIFVNIGDAENAQTAFNERSGEITQVLSWDFIILVRVMMRQWIWIGSFIRDSLEAISDFVDSNTQEINADNLANASNLKKLKIAIGALCVMGGYQNLFRTGGKVKNNSKSGKSNSERGTIILVDYLLGLSHIVSDSNKNEISKSKLSKLKAIPEIETPKDQIFATILFSKLDRYFEKSEDNGEEEFSIVRRRVKKLSKPSKPLKKTKSLAKWDCPMCTFLNEPTVNMCSMCSSFKPPEAINPKNPPTSPIEMNEEEELPKITKNRFLYLQIKSLAVRAFCAQLDEKVFIQIAKENNYKKIYSKLIQMSVKPACLKEFFNLETLERAERTILGRIYDDETGFKSIRNDKEAKIEEIIPHSPFKSLQIQIPTHFDVRFSKNCDKNTSDSARVISRSKGSKTPAFSRANLIVPPSLKAFYFEVRFTSKADPSFTLLPKSEKKSPDDFIAAVGMAREGTKIESQPGEKFSYIFSVGTGRICHKGTEIELKSKTVQSKKNQKDIKEDKKETFFKKSPPLPVGKCPNKDKITSKIIRKPIENKAKTEVSYDPEEAKEIKELKEEISTSIENSGAIIGCGYNNNSEIFFTLNGRRMRRTFSPVSGRFFPAVWIQSPRVSAEINFGQDPFVFDFKGYLPADYLKSLKRESELTKMTSQERKRCEMAERLVELMGHYPLEICITALERAKDNMQSAADWLLEFGWKELEKMGDNLLSMQTPPECADFEEVEDSCDEDFYQNSNEQYSRMGSNQAASRMHLNNEIEHNIPLGLQATEIVQRRDPVESRSAQSDLYYRRQGLSVKQIPNPDPSDIKVGQLFKISKNASEIMPSVFPVSTNFLWGKIGVVKAINIENSEVLLEVYLEQLASKIMLKMPIFVITRFTKYWNDSVEKIEKAENCQSSDPKSIYAKIQNAVSILRIRKAILKILIVWPKDEPLEINFFGRKNLFLKFLKLISAEILIPFNSNYSQNNSTYGNEMEKIKAKFTEMFKKVDNNHKFKKKIVRTILTRKIFESPESLENAVKTIRAEAESASFKKLLSEECILHFVQAANSPPSHIVYSSPGHNPYVPHIDKKGTIFIPGAKALSITFDSRSTLSDDMLTSLKFYSDDDRTDLLMRYKGNRSFQNNQSFIVNSNRCYYTFKSSGQTNYWGYTFKVSPINLRIDDFKALNCQNFELGCWLLDYLLNSFSDSDSSESLVHLFEALSWYVSKVKGHCKSRGVQLLNRILLSFQRLPIDKVPFRKVIRPLYKEVKHVLKQNFSETPTEHPTQIIQGFLELLSISNLIKTAKINAPESTKKDSGAPKTTVKGKEKAESGGSDTKTSKQRSPENQSLDDLPLNLSHVGCKELRLVKFSVSSAKNSHDMTETLRRYLGPYERSVIFVPPVVAWKAPYFADPFLKPGQEAEKTPIQTRNYRLEVDVAEIGYEKLSENSGRAVRGRFKRRVKSGVLMKNYLIFRGNDLESYIDQVKEVSRLTLSSKPYLSLSEFYPESTKIQEISDGYFHVAKDLKIPRNNDSYYSQMCPISGNGFECLSLSVTMWLYLHEELESGTVPLFCKGINMRGSSVMPFICLTKNNGLKVHIDTVNTRSTLSSGNLKIHTKKWVHLCLACDSKTAELFIDGNLASSINSVDPFVYNQEPIILGKLPFGLNIEPEPNFKLDVDIRDVRYYTRKLNFDLQSTRNEFMRCPRREEVEPPPLLESLDRERVWTPEMDRQLIEMANIEAEKSPSDQKPQRPTAENTSGTTSANTATLLSPRQTAPEGGNLSTTGTNDPSSGHNSSNTFVMLEDDAVRSIRLSSNTMRAIATNAQPIPRLQTIQAVESSPHSAPFFVRYQRDGGAFPPDLTDAEIDEEDVENDENDVNDENGDDNEEDDIVVDDDEDYRDDFDDSAGSDVEFPARGSETVMKRDIQSLVPETIERDSYPLLANIPRKAMQTRLIQLRIFNNKLAKVLWFVDFRQVGYRWSFAHRLALMRHLVFYHTKTRVFSAVLGQTGGYQKTRIQVNRPKALKAKEKGEKDGKKSIFGQIFRQLNFIPPSQLRSSLRAWNLTYEGEGGQDAGGLFRDSLSEMCEEIQRGDVPLMIRCPNGRSKFGNNQDKFVPDPSAKSELSLSMFSFLGKLMGVAIRGHHVLSLDFPCVIWKPLVGRSVTRKDIEAIDSGFSQFLESLEKMDGSMTEQDFQQLFPLTFTATGSNGKEVELKPGGAQLPVSFAQRSEYAALLEKHRLEEFDEQVAAIRRGLSTIVPINLLSLFTEKELEFIVCGKRLIDIDFLKENTQYKPVTKESDEHVAWFWEVLREFPHEDRKRFLRFVWGQSRLPLNSEDFREKFSLATNFRRGDESLPTSHTCFFSLELPKYSKKEVLKKMLLYAIRNCHAIDTDFMAVNVNWEED